MSKKLLVYTVLFAFFLIVFEFYRVAVAAEDRYVTMPPPVPTSRGAEVRLPYPPGPDFSWLRGDNFSLKELTDSKPANSTGSHRLVAGASRTVGRMPWYIQALFMISIAIIFVGSYFSYRYEKSKRLIGNSDR